MQWCGAVQWRGGSDRRNVDRCAGASVFSGGTRGAGERLSSRAASDPRAASAFSIAASSQAGCAGDSQSPRARAADCELRVGAVVLGVAADQPAGHDLIDNLAPVVAAAQPVLARYTHTSFWTGGPLRRN